MATTDPNVSKHLPLRPRDYLILFALVGEARHGYGIIRQVEEQTDGTARLDPANLYRVLRRMCALGWIRRTEDSEESRRRTYEIAGEGRAVLRAELSRLERLLDQVRPAVAGGA